MACIFISYSRRDSGIAALLRADLEKVGLEAWLDVSEIRPGDQWRASVQTGLERCSIILLILSPHSTRSDHVQHELEYAKEHDKLIIPLLWEPAQRSFEIIGTQYIDFHGQPYAVAIRELYAALKNHGMSLSTADDSSLMQTNVSSTWWEIEDLSSIPAPSLQDRNQYFDAQTLIEFAKTELWISGINLMRVVSNRIAFDNMLSNGRKLRALLIDPFINDDRLEEICHYIGIATNVMKARLNRSACELCEFSSFYPQQVSIRTTPNRLSIGSFIIDANEPHGLMTISPYFYKIEQLGRAKRDSEPPFLHLSKLSSPQWFEVFKRDFERIWDDAQTLDCHKLS